MHVAVLMVKTAVLYECDENLSDERQELIERASCISGALYFL